MLKTRRTLRRQWLDSAMDRSNADETSIIHRLKVWNTSTNHLARWNYKAKVVMKKQKRMKSDNHIAHCSREAIRFSLLTHKHKSFQSINGRETHFLMGPLKEEFMLLSAKRVVDPDHPEQVYLLRKALYGLKQAPRAV
ncbi:hypothetical protein Tco_0047867 [Tanacetum coccineum]|uniref:Reverse transcriptase n=1 Tax=Tanacetum coccineum TaxID=301880 RepID=A0ABQ5BI46_9ASTR